jgi:hypothetical protein
MFDKHIHIGDNIIRPDYNINNGSLWIDDNSIEQPSPNRFPLLASLMTTILGGVVVGIILAWFKVIPLC